MNKTLQPAEVSVRQGSPDTGSARARGGMRRIATMWLWAGLVLTCAILEASAATLHYVNLSNSTPAAPFLSWGNAATNIQDAVDAAAAGDEIVVSDGVYQTGGRLVYGALTNRVAVTKPVTMRSLNGPDSTTITGGSVLDIFGNPVLGDSAVRCVYLGDGAVLSGFRLTSGGTRVAGDALQEQTGGGVWCETKGSTVTNCYLTANAANFRGGGAYSGTLNHCLLGGNTSKAQGGGAYGSTLYQCNLGANTAQTEGGGACASKLSQCSLSGNASKTEGGGAYGSTLSQCTVNNNTAFVMVSRPSSKYFWHYAGSGGGVSASSLNFCGLSGNKAATGGGANASTLTNCSLAQNYAQELNPQIGDPVPLTGGANGAGATGSILDHCTLTGNQIFAGGSGAGAFGGLLNACTVSNNFIFNTGTGIGGGVCNSMLLNCLLIGNAANDIYISSSGGGASGCTLVNCTLSGNAASVTGGGAQGSLLTNCIVFNNTAPANANYDSSTLDHSCATPLPSSGAGNFTDNPLFVNLAAGDLHLQSNSPCINVGNNAAAPGATDLDGRSRVVGATVDLGAYEYPGPITNLFVGWLGQHGLATNATSDSADPDGDGANNWQEWVAGTDPTNGLSVLRLPPLAGGRTAVKISWWSMTNRTYGVERSTNLGARPAFQALAGNIPGQPGTTTFTDSNAPSTGPIYYRVAIQP